MKLKNLILGLTLVLVSSASFSQDDQTVKATTMGEGMYSVYLAKYENGEYLFEGLDENNWELSFKTYQENLKEIKIKKYASATSTESYLPDNSVFPCTYIRGSVQSHKAMGSLKNVTFTNEERIVVLDEWIYVLKDWKDKDHYVIHKILKKGELSGVKLMKAVLSSKKVGANANHVATLQNYLNDAFKKQGEMLATAEGKLKNEEYLKNLELAEKRWDIVRDSINGKYWNSAEGQAKQAEWSKADVVLKNDTQSTLYLCYGSGAYYELKPGQAYKFSCSGGGKVYRGTLRPNNSTQYDQTDNVLIDRNGTNCGKTINASSVVKY